MTAPDDASRQVMLQVACAAPMWTLSSVSVPFAGSQPESVEVIFTGGTLK